MNVQLKNDIKAWRSKCGYEKCLEAILNEGISKSLGEKLLTNNYNSHLSTLYEDALKRAMKGKNGIRAR